MYTEEIEQELLKLTPFEASVIHDVVWGYDAIMNLAKRYKKPRSTFYALLGRNKDLITKMREERIKQIESDLDKLQVKALDVYAELLNKGKPELQEKVATNILKGRGRLIDTQKIDSNVFQVTIIPPSSTDDNA